MPPYLEDAFLDRVRRAYSCALAVERAPAGPIWSPINVRRADIHAALLAEQNDALRAIFSAPADTELYHGCGDQCRCHDQPSDFVRTALTCGHARDAAYQAARLAALVDSAGDRSVIEIGPGMGRCAFFAFKRGITDYTTIDLPLGVVAQACFLGRTLGPDKLWFDGEAADPAGKIKLLFAGRPPSARFGVAVNADSMTEMPWGTAFDYALWLGRHAHLFFSLNHQSNAFTVAELMAFSAGKRLVRRGYHPRGYGSHLAYVEEVYRLRGTNCPGWRRDAFRLLISVRGRARHALNFFMRRASAR